MKKRELEVIRFNVNFREDGLEAIWSILHPINDNFNEEENKIVDKAMEDIERIVINSISKLYEKFEQEK